MAATSKIAAKTAAVAAKSSQGERHSFKRSSSTTSNNSVEEEESLTQRRQQQHKQEQQRQCQVAQSKPLRFGRKKKQTNTMNTSSSNNNNNKTDASDSLQVAIPIGMGPGDVFEAPIPNTSHSSNNNSSSNKPNKTIKIRCPPGIHKQTRFRKQQWLRIPRYSSHVVDRNVYDPTTGHKIPDCYMIQVPDKTEGVILTDTLSCPMTPEKNPSTKLVLKKFTVHIDWAGVHVTVPGNYAAPGTKICLNVKNVSSSHHSTSEEEDHTNVTDAGQYHILEGRIPDHIQPGESFAMPMQNRANKKKKKKTLSVICPQDKKPGDTVVYRWTLTPRSGDGDSSDDDDLPVSLQRRNSSLKKDQPTTKHLQYTVDNETYTRVVDMEHKTVTWSQDKENQGNDENNFAMVRKLVYYYPQEGGFSQGEESSLDGALSLVSLDQAPEIPCHLVRQQPPPQPLQRHGSIRQSTDNRKKVRVDFQEIAMVQATYSVEEKAQWLRATCQRLAAETKTDGSYVRVSVRNERRHMIQDATEALLSLSGRMCQKKWRPLFLDESFRTVPSLAGSSTSSSTSGGFASGDFLSEESFIEPRAWFDHVIQEAFQTYPDIFDVSSSDDKKKKDQPPQLLLDQHARFLGRLLGKALFEGYSLPPGCSFSPLLYKHILGLPVTAMDLPPDSFSSTLTSEAQRGTSSGSDVSTATTSSSLHGNEEDKQLMKRLLLETSLRHHLLDKIKSQLQQFLLGFLDVIPEPLLLVFTSYQEFEQLLQPPLTQLGQ